jgi:hypothetical protein
METVAAALLVLWTGLRSRWRGWLGLALIVGLFAGVVEAAAAGARRTDSAYPQLVAWSRAPDVLIYSQPSEPAFADLAPAALERLPQVTAGATLSTFVTLNPAVITLIAPAGDQVPAALWHRKILSGQLPDPGRPDEVDVSFTLAQALHLTAGGTLGVTMLGARGQPVPLRLHIAGVDAAPASSRRSTAPGSTSSGPRPRSTGTTTASSTTARPPRCGCAAARRTWPPCSGTPATWPGASRSTITRSTPRR